MPTTDSGGKKKKKLTRKRSSPRSAHKKPLQCTHIFLTMRGTFSNDRQADKQLKATYFSC